jgi:hypothetical protein
MHHMHGSLARLDAKSKQMLRRWLLHTRDGVANVCPDTPDVGMHSLPARTVRVHEHVLRLDR